ncbi:MAG: cobalamin biosynthesis protein CbiX [Myxococcota bacterium]
MTPPPDRSSFRSPDPARIRLLVTALAVCLMTGAALSSSAEGHGTEDAAHAKHHAHAPSNAFQDHAAPAGGPAGFLVVAPDRGFLGNEEIRDAIAAFEAAAGTEAEAVFVSDERTETRFDAALAALRARGAARITTLPFFLSDAHPGFKLARDHLAGHADVRIAPVFGESYLAVEVLSDRLRAIRKPEKHNVVLLGQGASSEAERNEMTADLDAIVARARAGLDLRHVRTLVWSTRSSEDPEAERKKLTRSLMREYLRFGRTAVVPFNLGMKLDSMMSMSGFMKRFLPDGTQFIDGDVLPHPAIALWMEREAMREAPLRMEDLGVVFLAHGAGFEWNQGMRDAIAGLTNDYRIEFAFSMADQPVVQRAVTRLEERGAKAIVVVRVFGLASSFQGMVDRMFGLDVEAKGHGHGGGHHGMMMMGRPGARIRTPVRIASVGGLEDAPLFAEVLLERARALSEDPANETIVLVAHGAGSDRSNDHWKKNLASLTRQMEAMGGSAFRAIESGTWREDWPDKREAEIERIRALVAEAGSDGGRAIVVPARTTGEGPARHLLEGLDFALGSGFAPSPQFTRWVEKQILEGAARLGIEGAEADAQQAAQVEHAEAAAQHAAHVGHAEADAQHAAHAPH